MSEEAERRGLSDTVIRLGHQEHIQKFYEALDLYVSPSLTEGISNVILEAIALETPVVATAVGGTPEIITHQHDGFLVPAGSPEAIAKAVGHLLETPQERARLAANGYETISERFSFHRRMERVCRLYDDLFN